MTSPEGRVVARIGKPHALRGEVTVQLHTDDPEERLVPGAVFETVAEPGSGVPRQLTLATTRVHRGIWLLGFEGIPDRTGAESLRGTRLVLTDAAESSAGGAADEWYEEDLVGLAAVSPAGEPVGEVTALEVAPGQDRLRIARSDGAEALVPFVEAIVPEVDVAAGRVVVDAPAGLLDLDAKGE